MKAQPRMRREPWRKDTAPPRAAVVLMKRQYSSATMLLTADSTEPEAPGDASMAQPQFLNVTL